MSDLQAIADRFEIEALRGEFTDALMLRDYDRFASLFTQDGAWRIPYIDVELVGREEIRAGIERMQGLWGYFVQTTHPGTIQLEGNIASGRAYISELGHMHDGHSELNYSVYHDRYQRTPDGWKFTERVYEVRYLDTTPLRARHPTQPGRQLTRRSRTSLRTEARNRSKNTSSKRNNNRSSVGRYPSNTNESPRVHHSRAS